MVKNLPAVQETQVWTLGWEDPLEKEMAIHSSILAWRIPVDRRALQFTGSQRVGYNWTTNTTLLTSTHLPSLRTSAVPSSERWLIVHTTWSWSGCMWDTASVNCGWGPQPPSSHHCAFRLVTKAPRHGLWMVCPRLQLVAAPQRAEGWQPLGSCSSEGLSTDDINVPQLQAQYPWLVFFLNTNGAFSPQTLTCASNFILKFNLIQSLKNESLWVIWTVPQATTPGVQPSLLCFFPKPVAQGHCGTSEASRGCSDLACPVFPSVSSLCVSTWPLSSPSKWNISPSSALLCSCVHLLSLFDQD